MLYDADGGVIDYNAFGETIDDITLDAEQTTPFFGRVKRIHGHISGLPSQATVNIKPNAGGFKLDANNPIGSVEALLTSGPDASLPAGQLGAQVEDLTDRFTAFARVQGLRLVDVTTGPGDAVAGHVKLASTPLRVRYLRTGQTIDASLSPIPSDMTVSFDPAAGKLDYNANAGIASIDATVTADAPLFGRAKRIVARVEGLPNVVERRLQAGQRLGRRVLGDPGGRDDPGRARRRRRQRDAARRRQVGRRDEGRAERVLALRPAVQRQHARASRPPARTSTRR